MKRSCTTDLGDTQSESVDEETTAPVVKKMAPAVKQNIDHRTPNRQKPLGTQHDMPEIELLYFSSRLRAEFICLTLLASGQKFRDIRLAYEEWTPEKKAETPFGQMPVLVYKGKKYAQSVAIANFVAREFGLYGESNLEALRIDEVMQLAEDVKTRIVQDWYFAPDDTKKAEAVTTLKEQTFPKFLRFIQKLLEENGGTGFFVGNSVTLADLVVYDLADSALLYDPEAIAAYPSVQKLRSNVEAIPAIKSYLDSTPRFEI